MQPDFWALPADARTIRTGERYSRSRPEYFAKIRHSDLRLGIASLGFCPNRSSVMGKPRCAQCRAQNSSTGVELQEILRLIREFLQHKHLVTGTRRRADHPAAGRSQRNASGKSPSLAQCADRGCGGNGRRSRDRRSGIPSMHVRRLRLCGLHGKRHTDWNWRRNRRCQWRDRRNALAQPQDHFPRCGAIAMSGNPDDLFGDFTGTAGQFPTVASIRARTG